jgi:hypothetical protein
MNKMTIVLVTALITLVLADKLRSLPGLSSLPTA